MPAVPAMAAVAAMVMVMVVGMLDQYRSRPATIIPLRPGSVELVGRIGIVRARWFGAGRETGQQDDRREESQSTHTIDMVSPRRDSRSPGKARRQYKEM
jgi:hypothetical protein